MCHCTWLYILTVYTIAYIVLYKCGTHVSMYVTVHTYCRHYFIYGIVQVWNSRFIVHDCTYLLHTLLHISYCTSVELTCHCTWLYILTVYTIAYVVLYKCGTHMSLYVTVHTYCRHYCIYRIVQVWNSCVIVRGCTYLLYTLLHMAYCTSVERMCHCTWLYILTVDTIAYVVLYKCGTYVSVYVTVHTYCRHYCISRIVQVWNSCVIVPDCTYLL